MPTIKNMTYAPITIAVRGGKDITVEYGGTAEVTAAQLRLKAVKKLIDEGKLGIVPDKNKRRES